MKQLSDMLKAMKSPEDSQKELSHGLTPNAGVPAIPPRNIPLTAGELTQIASKLLLKEPIGYLSKTKKYGRKLVEGIWFDDMPIGEEEKFDISFPMREKLPIELLQSALRQSPATALTTHLTHLAVHKRLGSNEQDRALLLRDYVSALRGFSDFVVYIVCKCLWESSPESFFPKISVINDLCNSIQTSLMRRLNEMAGTLPAPKPKPRYVKSEDTEEGKRHRRELCDFLMEHGESDLFEMTRMFSNYQLEMMARWKGFRLPTDEPRHTPSMSEQFLNQSRDASKS